MKTNRELAKDMNTTSRQISKSRKRGYVTNTNGEMVRYTAPPKVYISKSSTGVKKHKGRGTKIWKTNNK